MTQKEKDLLLKDICGRIPYGLKVKNVNEPNSIYNLLGVANDSVMVMSADKHTMFLNIKSIKPYLFPLSSMTDEQRDELKKYTCPDGTGYFKEDRLCCPINHFGEQIPFILMSKTIEWLDRNRFDYRGIIPMGLADDASKLNIY